MKSQILGDYLFHFLPVILIPPVLYFLDNTVPPADLFRAGLLYPLFLLALKGLTVFFPAGNLKDRSLTRMIEHALLQGTLFATVIIHFAGLDPKDQADLPQTLTHFARGTLMMGALHLVASFYTQRSLRARERAPEA